MAFVSIHTLPVSLLTSSAVGDHRHPQGRRIPEPVARRIGAFCSPTSKLLGSIISDCQSNAFSSFTTSLSDSARRANQAFGLGIRPPSQCCMRCAYCVNRPRNAETIQDTRLLHWLYSVSLASVEDTLLALLQRWSGTHFHGRIIQDLMYAWICVFVVYACVYAMGECQGSIYIINDKHRIDI